MSALVSIKVRATDASYLELLCPLAHVPAEEAPAGSAAIRAANFRLWAARPRQSVGLPDAGRDFICISVTY